MAEKWSVMNREKFNKYLEQLRKSKKPNAVEHADELELNFISWKKRGQPDEDAIRKSFASVQTQEANERLKGDLSDEQRLHWQNVKGHALAQHQKNQKFFSSTQAQEQPLPIQRREPPEIIDAEIIDRPRPPQGPPRRGGQPPRPQPQPQPQPQPHGQNAPNPGYGPPNNNWQGPLQPGHGPPNFEWHGPPMLKLIITSYPVVGVPFTIFRKGEERTLTRQDFMRAFGDPDTAQGAYEIYEEYKRRKFENRVDAQKFIIERASTYTRNPGRILHFILTNEFGIDEDIVTIVGFTNGIRIFGPKGKVLLPIKENFKTPLEIYIPNGNYKISVGTSLPKNKDFFAKDKTEEKKEYELKEWRVYRESAGKLNPIVIKKDKLEKDENNVLLNFSLNESLQLTAIYEENIVGNVTHEDRPLTGGPYRSAIGSRSKIAASSDSLVAGLGIHGIRERLGRIVNPGEGSLKAADAKYNKNPHFLAAVNKGKRILNKYGKIEYERIFGDFKKTWEYEKDQIQADKKAKQADFDNAKKATKDAKKKLGDLKKDDSNYGATLEAYKEALQSERESYVKLRDIELGLAFSKKFNEDLQRRSVALNNALLDRSGAIAKMVCRQYQIPLNSTDEKAVTGELDRYATDLAEDFATRGRTIRHGMMRGLGVASRSTQTFGAAGMNVLGSLWDLVFGPWTWTSILVVFQFFFILTYVGYNIYYLWIFPIIGAIFTFLMNFSDSFKPLDWWTHLMSGANVGYSALLLLLSLDALDWTGSSMWFWIVWGIVGFIGVMQFYQIGGWRVVFQGALIVLVFAWLALGPYAAYYQQALDQIKKPVEIVYTGVKEAFSNIWLLATNPTEFYARQQAINIRPERPVDLEKGVEVTLLQALPQSVPAGQEFALTAVLTNEGVLNTPAKDIRLTLACNQWCDARAVDPVQDASYIPRNQISGTTKIYYLKDKLERSEATSLNVRGFKALGDSVRVGEVRLAKVSFNLSYNYSSSSSLVTQVMSQDEVNRRLQNDEQLFQNVLAVAKLSPAQLSLNVGPQPLIYSADRSAMLLVSIFSTRDDGLVKLSKGSRIIITLPRTIGQNLDCNNQKATVTEEKEVVEYIVPSDVTILPHEFNSIFSFICNFNPNNVQDVKSDIITAELPDYTFVLTMTKDVPVTPPIGIIFNPFERQCNKCGDGAFEACSTASECYGFSTDDNTCWYAFSSATNFDTIKNLGQTLTGEMQSMFTNRCHSCVDLKCNQLVTQNDCENEALSRCGLSCKWDSNAVNPSLTQIGDQAERISIDSKGACTYNEAATGVTQAAKALTGDIQTKIIQAAKENGISAAEAPVFLKLAAKESDFRHCCQDPAHNTANTGCVNTEGICDTTKILTSFDGTSLGVMQLNKNAHPVWFTASDSSLCSQAKYKMDCNLKKLACSPGKTAYDQDCNIRLGVDYLIALKNLYGAKGIHFTCQELDAQYTDWNAALRAYVGTGCDAAHKNYVDLVNNIPISSDLQSKIDQVYAAA